MTLVVLAATLLLPPSAHANAGGVIESDEEYRYGDLYLRWRTGDACDNSSSCFQLASKPAPMFRWFFGDEVSVLSGSGGIEGRSLWKLNVPPEENGLIFGQLFAASGSWFVYDAKTHRLLVETPKYPEALAVWRQQGLAEPTFEDAEDAPTQLSRSAGNILESVLLWSIPLALVALIAVPLMLRRRRRMPTNTPPRPAP